MTYWLHLPQSLPQKKSAAAGTPSSTSSLVAEQSSLFSVVKKLQSKLTFTPGVAVTGDDDGGAPPDLINLRGGTPASATKVADTNDNDKGGPGSKKLSCASSPENSKSRFDAFKAKLYPKTAELLANCRAHGTASFWPYYGPYDILENQSAFDNANNC